MKKPQFKVGDAVFYPAAGVGVITGIEDIYVGAQWESCFVIRIDDSQVTIKVPQSKAEQSGVRALLSGKKLKDLFRVLADKGKERVMGGNVAEYYRSLERKINTGSCLELGEVVRDLTRQKKASHLSFDEARLLETARHFLTRELAVVEGIPQLDASDRIRTHIGEA